MKTRPSRVGELSMGALLGSCLGLFGWWIGLVITLVAAGDDTLMLELLPEGFLLTAAVCVAMILCLRLLQASVASVGGEGVRVYRLGTSAGIALALGVLLLYVRRVVLPALLSNPKAVAFLQSTGSTINISVWMPALILLVGCVLGLLSIAALGRLR